MQNITTIQELPNVSFASANTSEGFISYFKEIFDEKKLSRLIVLKGGPGTGKSTLMRAFSSYAAKRGYIFRPILCSSDPSSLDGILVPELEIGIIDGTSPHSYDPAIPCLTSATYDLARFLDRKCLTDKKEEIISLQKTKAAAYKGALAYISCAGKLKREIAGTLDFECQKAKKLAKELLGNAGGTNSGEEGEISYIPYSSFSMNGKADLEAFPDNDKTVIIKPYHCADNLLMQTIALEALNMGKQVVVSPDPLCPRLPCALSIPSIDLRIISSNESGTTPTVKAKEYIRTPDKQEKEKIKKLEAHIRKLTEDGAQFEFSQMKNAHFALEKIYSSAMDFVTKESAERSLFDELLS